MTMHLMFHVGADSVDSSGWRTKAAFGAIQLPGVGDRYITTNEKHKPYRDLSRSEKEILDNCVCPVCRKHNLSDLRKSFQLRALHNAWVFQKEIEIAREMTNKGKLSKLHKENLGEHNLFHVFQYANKLKAAKN